MIIEQLKDKKEFTGNEAIISEYILQNMAKIQDLTVEELANETFTSKASVVRLCKKMKVDGYRNFQRKLEAELNEIYRLSYLINKEPINEKSTLKDILNIIPSIYETAVVNTKLFMDERVIKIVIDTMKQAEIIELYGIGICQTIARTAAFKFNSIGIESKAVDGINEHSVMMNKSKRNKVAILLTFTGANPYIVTNAKYLKQAGYYVLGIGGNDHVELEKYCSKFIEIYTKEMILSLEIMSSYTAMNYVLDILFASLLSQNYKQNIDASLDVIKTKKFR